MQNLVIEVNEKVDQNLLLDYGNFLDTYFENTKDYSLVFVDNKMIQKINLEFRQKDKPTDVISFEGDDDYLGDIVISYEKIKEQSNNYGHSFTREMLFLFTHGYLHLSGYDHQNHDSEEVMFSLQEKLLSDYGVQR